MEGISMKQWYSQQGGDRGEEEANVQSQLNFQQY